MKKLFYLLSIVLLFVANTVFAQSTFYLNENTSINNEGCVAYQVCYNTPTILEFIVNFNPQNSPTLDTRCWDKVKWMWQSSPDNNVWTDMTVAWENIYDYSDLNNQLQERKNITVTVASKMYYRLKIERYEKQGVGCGDYTAYANFYTRSALVQATVVPLAGTISANQNICYNTAPAQLVGSVPYTTIPSGNSISYQWQSSSDDVTFTNISGATSQNYTPPVLTASKYYRRNAIYKNTYYWTSAAINGTLNTSCNTVSSASIKITVNPEIIPGTVTAATTLTCSGTPTTITSGVATGGTGTGYTYQWQKNGVDIVGATALTYTSAYNDIYKMKVKNNNCFETSSSVNITSRSPLTAGTIGNAQTICYNSIPAQLTGAAATGGSYMAAATYTYQWQQSTDNITWNNILNATALNYTPTALTQTTYFRRNVTVATSTCTASSNVIIITVYPQLQPPTITGDQTVCLDLSPEEFSVITPATGGTGVYTYQWLQSSNGVLFENYAGATSTLFLPNQPQYTTQYKLSVTSGTCGTVTSNTSTVTVNPRIAPGTITNTNGVLCYNTAPAQLTSTAATGGLGNYIYQWQVGYGNGDSQTSTNWYDVTSGTGATTLNYSPVASVGEYKRFRIRVQSGNCIVKYSNEAIINTRTDLVAGTISANQTICHNSIPAQLNGTSPSGGTALVTTTTYTYQWQKSLDGTTWTDISGAVGQNYTPTALTVTTKFRRKDAVALCVAKYTNEITITVLSPFVASVISTDQTICYSNIPAQLSVITPASGGSGAYTYQWQQSSDNITYTDIALATNNFYQSTALTSSTYYKLNVTSGTCGTVTSNISLVTVNPQVVAGTVSNTNNVLCSGSTPSALTSTVATSGMGGTYSYQWQQSLNNGTTWTDVSSGIGATTLNYTPVASTTGEYRKFRVKVTNSTCPIVYSNDATINTRTDITAGTISANQSICYNSIPAQLTGTAPTGGVATATTTTYTYQWQQSLNGTTWTDISGAVGQNYTPTALTVTTKFRRTDKVDVCAIKYTNEITITVYSNLTSSTIGNDQTICYSNIPTQLSVITPASGGSGAYTYQWQQSSDNITYTDIAGANSVDYQPTSLTSSTYYKLKVTSGTCGTVTSNVSLVTVNPQVVAGNTYFHQTVCYGTIPAEIKSNPATSGMGGTYTYQWQESIDNLTYIDIPSATTLAYTPTALTYNKYFRVKVTNSTCPVVYSNYSLVTVRANVVAGTISTSQNICYNTIPDTIQGSAPYGGEFPSYTPTYAYQWQQSLNGTTWTDIAIDGTKIYYVPSNLTQTTYFRRKDKEISCDWTYTNTVTITVYPQITSGTITSDQTICYGSFPSVISGTAPTGGNGIYTYSWAYSLNNVAWLSIDSAKSENYQSAALTQKLYLKRFVNSYNCGMVASNMVTINVNAQIFAGSITADQNISYNGVPSLLTGTNASGGNGVFTYKWQQSIDDTIYADIPSATAVSYQPTALKTTSYYKRLAYSNSCGPIESNKVTVTVFDKLYAGTIGDGQKICYNAIPTNLTAKSSPLGGSGSYIYQWYQSYDKKVWDELSGANASSYQPGAFTKNVYFKRMVVASTSFDTAYSNIIQIIVSEPINGGVVGYSDTLCFQRYMDELINISLASGGMGTKAYQWEASTDKISWTPILGATSIKYNNGNPNTTSIYYQRKVTDQYCGSATSNLITITVLPALSNPSLATANQTICYNTAPSKIVGYSPTGGTGVYTHQWQQSTDSSNWYNITGATSIDYQPSTLRQTTWFRRRSDVAIYNCDYQITDAVKVTVLQEVSAGIIDDNQTVCYNTAPLQLKGSTPTGGNGTYTYKWQKSTDGSTWSDITGVTTSNILPPALTQTTYYHRKAISNTCESNYSNVVAITVNSPLAAGTIGDDNTICYGTNPEPLYTLTNPSGANGTYTYQWQQSTNNSFWNDIPSATNNYYYPTALTQTMYYRKKVISSCNSAFTPSIKVTVFSDMYAGDITSSQTLTSYKTPAQLIGTDAIGGDNVYTYQWQKSTDNSSWVNLISFATGLNYQPIKLNDTAWYRRIDQSGCGIDTTPSIVINILTPLTIATIGNDQNICSGIAPAKLTETIAPIGGTGVYTYQWQKSIDGTIWSNILNATGKDYQSTPLTSTTYFRRYTYNSVYDTTVSNIVVLAIYPTLVTGTISSNSATICYNSTPEPLAFTVAPIGGSESYTYQWQQSLNGSVWNDIPSATLEYFQPTALTTKMYYRTKINDGCSSVTSNSFAINVLPEVVAGTISANQTIAYNRTPSAFITTATTSQNSFTYQWQQSTDGIAYADILNSTTKDYVAPKLTDTTWYRRTSIDMCGTFNTNAIKVTVLPQIFAGTISVNQSLCNNVRPNELIGTPASGGNGTYAYQWQQSLNGTTWSNILNATTLNFHPDFLTQTTKFRRLDMIQNYDTTITNIVTIEVYSNLVAGTIATTINLICHNTQPSALFTSTQPSGSDNNYTYQWEVSDWGYVYDEIQGATLEYYQPPVLTTSKFYRKKVTSGCMFAYTDSVKITVKPALYGGIIEKSQTIGYGKTPAQLNGEIPVTTSTYTYQWQFSNDSIVWTNIINDSKNKDYQPTALTQPVLIRRVVINSCTADTSNVLKMNVLPEIINTISSDQKICHNTIPTLLSGNTPTGGTGVYSYQWEQSLDGTTWNEILNATGKDYQPHAISQYTLFRRKVASEQYDTSYSNIVIIENYAPLVANVIGNSQTICNNTSPEALLSLASSTGGTGNYTYQWQSSTNQAEWNDIANESNDYLVSSALNQTLHFRLKTSDDCLSSYSNEITINVKSNLDGGHIEKSQSIALGSTPELLTGSLPIGGIGVYTYQWQQSTDSIQWSNVILNSTEKDYQPLVLTETTFFKRITFDVCSIDTTAAVKIEVLPIIIPGTLSENQTICFGSTPALISGTVPTGGMGNYTYQWEQSIDGTTWADVVGATSLNYQPAPLQASINYRRKEMSLNSEDAYTNVIAITVRTVLTAPNVSYDSVYCKGSDVTLSVELPVYTYKWYNYMYDSIAVGSMYQLKNIQANTKLYVKPIDANLCEGDISTINVIVDTVKANFTVSVNSVEEGNSVQFISASINADTYEWFFNDGDGSFSASTWHYYNKAGTYSAALKITSENGCTDSIFKSNVVTVTLRNGTEINDVNIIENVKIYPNPVLDYLTIENDDQENVSITIFLPSGQLLWKDSFNGDKKIDFTSYASGIYTIVVQKNNEVKSFKVIK